MVVGVPARVRCREHRDQTTPKATPCIDRSRKQAPIQVGPRGQGLAFPARLERATSGFGGRRSDPTELREHWVGALGRTRTRIVHLRRVVPIQLDHERFVSAAVRIVASGVIWSRCSRRRTGILHHLKVAPLPVGLRRRKWSGWHDLNVRSPASEAGTLGQAELHPVGA